MFEAILIACAVIVIAISVMALVALWYILRAINEFIVEFRAHFDDAFVRQIMKKMGRMPVRKL